MTRQEQLELELSNLQRLSYETNELHRTQDISMRVWRERSRKLAEMIMTRQNELTEIKAKKWREENDTLSRQYGLFDTE